MHHFVEVKFFASLREVIGHSELQLSVENTGELVAALSNRLGEVNSAYLMEPNIRIAVNQELVEGDWKESSLLFRAGDEIAFLPPITGG
jgi:molybdopterin converting factor subunit 1